jgi:hypothetical protein
MRGLLVNQILQYGSSMWSPYPLPSCYSLTAVTFGETRSYRAFCHWDRPPYENYRTLSGTATGFSQCQTVATILQGVVTIVCSAGWSPAVTWDNFTEYPNPWYIFGDVTVVSSRVFLAGLPPVYQAANCMEAGFNGFYPTCSGQYYCPH